jgi:putative tricarboxylic transport membrane protein
VAADRIAAVAIFVVAINYIRIARAYHGLTVADVIGPSAYPYIIGGLMAVLATVLFIRSSPKPAAGTFWAGHGKPIMLAVSLYIYIRLLEPAGFLLSTFVYIAFGHIWLGERSWIKATALSASVTTVLWLLFNRLFDLNLPAGVLGWPR